MVSITSNAGVLYGVLYSAKNGFVLSFIGLLLVVQEILIITIIISKDKFFIVVVFDLVCNILDIYVSWFTRCCNFEIAISHHVHIVTAIL